METVSPNKRLIVCCDGTWEDGNSEINHPLSNITRIARALKPHAEVSVDGVRTLVPQVTFYQKGVGTGVLDRYIGGLTGAGLSANVRAAYAFIAENFQDGDELFFFGFSRGAFTARAVAGLVADMGLLTRRGMDNFPLVYDDYYKKKLQRYDDETRAALGFRSQSQIDIRVIGVFDTVGFHHCRLANRLFGEKLELPNTRLSRNVQYAFHALSLDERRKAFSPTLWHVPSPESEPGQELLQVWFSGAHTDVGGGEVDPRLSDISLAWMVAQCSKHRQLDFDLDYLFADPRPPVEDAARVPWATSRGREEKWSWQRWIERLLVGEAVRSPLRDVHGGEGCTYEWIHESVKDRNLDGRDAATARFCFWPSRVVARRVKSESQGQGQGHGQWLLKNGCVIREVEALGVELFLRGRIKTVRAGPV